MHTGAAQTARFTWLFSIPVDCADGREAAVQYAAYRSPLGDMTLQSDGKSLTGLWFDGQKYAPSLPPCAGKPADLPVFAQTARWLDQYFSGEMPRFLPALAPQGTPFRRLVWALLLQIPPGSVTTYAKLAAQAAKNMGRARMSAQAVGGAVGHNPVSILIPCHRVLGSDGSLTGYAGGLERKAALLRLEQAMRS